MLSIRYNERYFIDDPQFSADADCAISQYLRDKLFTNGNNEQIERLENDRLSLAYERLGHIPREVVHRFSDRQILDLTSNKFKNVSFLSRFKNLNSLILDKNISIDLSTLPDLPKLKLLWLNNCGLSDLNSTVTMIAKCCPNLKILSLMGNSLAFGIPEKEYRKIVIKTLPRLQFLDDKAVKRR